MELQTEGKVEATVLREFLTNGRPDLPDNYLPLLCGVESLGLTSDDYMPTATPNSLNSPRPPTREAWKARVNRADIAARQLYEIRHPLVYIALFCDNPQKMREALQNRIERAGMTQAKLGRRFNLTGTNSRCMELGDFMNGPLRDGLRPIFSPKLQDRFWEICEFLKDEIQKCEGGVQLSTEDFVRVLLTEGTAGNPEKTLLNLLKINGIYQSRITDASR